VLLKSADLRLERGHCYGFIGQVPPRPLLPPARLPPSFGFVAVSHRAAAKQ
jgi:hypothetical protein